MRTECPVCGFWSFEEHAAEFLPEGRKIKNEWGECYVCGFKLDESISTWVQVKYYKKQIPAHVKKRMGIEG